MNRLVITCACLTVLLVVQAAPQKRDATCVVGAGAMYVPPGQPRPEPCPVFRTSDGGCFFGDMGVDKAMCVMMLRGGEKTYLELPTAQSLGLTDF